VSCLHTGRKWGSHANTDRIVMGLGRWKEIVVHELAHVMTRRIHGAWTVAPHGKEFCGIYLFLLREFMGEAHAETLKRNFVKLKIPFEMPARVRLPKAA
jgi:ribosome-associated toxin RatA of RatAB toxin-antitoxin module